MKTVVALLAVACSLAHAVPRPDKDPQMKGQSNATTTPKPMLAGVPMSPESTSSISTPNIADQEKQPPQMMNPPPTLSPEKPSMPQESMYNMGEGSSTTNSMMGPGANQLGSTSQTSQSREPPNMYQMGMPNSN